MILFAELGVGFDILATGAPVEDLRHPPLGRKLDARLRDPQLRRIAAGLPGGTVTAYDKSVCETVLVG